MRMCDTYITGYEHILRYQDPWKNKRNEKLKQYSREFYSAIDIMRPYLPNKNTRMLVMNIKKKYRTAERPQSARHVVQLSELKLKGNLSTEHKCLELRGIMDDINCKKLYRRMLNYLKTEEKAIGIDITKMRSIEDDSLHKVMKKLGYYHSKIMLY